MNITNMGKIDIRDLRVGDWIYHKDCPIPLQVSGVKDNEVYLKHSFEHNRTIGFIRKDRPSVCSIDEIRPIPLTEKILEKNGFVYDDLPMSQYFEQYGLQLYYGGNGFRINCGVNSSLVIDSVHQLQNILRDTGIEKEITI